MRVRRGLAGLGAGLLLLVAGWWVVAPPRGTDRAPELATQLYRAARAPAPAAFLALWAEDAQDAAQERWHRLRALLPDSVDTIPICDVRTDDLQIVVRVQPHPDARPGAPCHTVVMRAQGSRVVVVDEASPWETLAETRSETADQISDSTGGAPLVRAIVWNADRLERSGDDDRAMAGYQSALAIARPLGNPLLEATVLMNIGYLQTSLDRLAEAETTLETAHRLAEQSGSTLVTARALSNLGRLSYFRSEYRRAVEQYSEGLELARAAQSPRDIAVLSVNLSAVRMDQAEYRRALAHVHETLALARQIGDELLESASLHNLGDLYNELGSYDEAIEHYSAALALKERIGNTISAANTLHSMAQSRINQDRLDEAMPLLEESLRRVEDGKDTRMEAHVRHSIGAIQSQRGQFEPAMASLESSLRLATEQQELGLVSTTHSLMADALRQAGRLDQAATHFAAAASLARDLSSPLVLYRALAGRARLEFERGASGLARRFATAAIEQIERLREDALGEDTRQSFFQDKLTPYHILMQLELAGGRASEALAHAERAKARVLLDAITAGRTLVTADMTDAERRTETDLLMELREANAAAIAAEEAASEPASVDSARRRRQTARGRLSTFRSALYSRRPQTAVKRGDARWLGAREVCRETSADVALVEYALTDTDAFAFVVRCGSKGGVTSVKLGLPSDALSAASQAFREQLATRGPGFRAPAQSLYEALVQPLVPALEGAELLIVVPDAALWELPFQALMDGDEFLIERVAIAYAPSLAVLAERTRVRAPGKPSDTQLLAFGNPGLNPRAARRGSTSGSFPPLPDAEDEVRALQVLYGTTRTQIHTGAAASESQFKTDAPRSSVIHFATHAVFDNRSPSHSFLLLASDDEGEDGLLEAWEIMDLDLDADVAVLAACETARGRVRGGEGVLGLTWAFFIAGVDATVASQWMVESKVTSELMVRFHQQMLSDSPSPASLLSRARALQRAVRATRALADEHPFAWAPFIIVGTGL